MTYLVQDEIARNEAMNSRIAQAAASEGIVDNPDSWVFNTRRVWAAAPGWDGAWASYKVSSPGADPGKNEGVITDAMILSQVQAMIPPPPEPTAVPTPL